jgi:Flp pilus assembly protein TadB
MGVRERLVASITGIKDRGQRLVQLHRELLTAELKEKGKRSGAGIGLFIGAALLALYALGFALATVVVALALVLPLWAALLIVTVALFLIVAILALVGRGKLQQAKTPAPEAAIAEAKTTAEMVKTNLRATLAGVRARVAPRRAGGSGSVESPAATPAPEPTGPGGRPPETSHATGAGDS